MAVTFDSYLIKRLTDSSVLSAASKYRNINQISCNYSSITYLLSLEFDLDIKKQESLFISIVNSKFKSKELYYILNLY